MLTGLLVRISVLCSAAVLAGCSLGSVTRADRIDPQLSPPAAASAAAKRNTLELAAQDLRTRAADAASRMVGRPYRWGGDGPTGFDCSGLVSYAYRQVGKAVPRTSEQLFRDARPLPLKSAAAGDLVFFQTTNKVSHVGIYLGDRRFVHAPSSGKSVHVASLDERYYATHFKGAGRLAP